MSNPIGLYLHVPFCDAKCPYCDFYSMRGSTEDWERYTESIISHLYDYQDRNLAVDSVYFGGGTPSLLGAERLGRMLEAVRGAFALSPEAEITVEVNPTREPGRFFEGLAEAGVTRVSIGLQSAQAAELRALGRRHTAEQAAHAVALAHRAGIANVSLDLMLAVPGQTVESLRESVRFCAQAGVTHVSAYLLKIEPARRSMPGARRFPCRTRTARAISIWKHARSWKRAVLPSMRSRTLPCRALKAATT